MTVPDLSRLERVDLHEAWLSEPADFTPWLASEENLALLGEALDMELEHLISLRRRLSVNSLADLIISIKRKVKGVPVTAAGSVCDPPR